MWQRIISATAVLLLMFGSAVSSARIIRVDAAGKGDFRTIQGAVNASTAGDVIVVAPGTYTGPGNRDIDLQGRPIVVKSEQGAETCIIDCQGSASEPHRGFYFRSGEDISTVVQGFTITGGYIPGSAQPHAGGGLFLDRASPQIVDCIVRGNVASEGGGIACDYSNAVIVNCLICDNLASSRPPSWARPSRGNGGGGILLTWGNPQVINCIIVGNRSSGGAAGLDCMGSFALVNCTIHGNRTGHGDSGISMFGWPSDHGIVRNCIIWGTTPEAR